MPKHADAGFSKVAVLLLGLVILCVGIAVPLLMTGKKAAPAAAAGATAGTKAAIPLLGTEVDAGYAASMKSDLRSVAVEIESQNVDDQDYSETTWKSGMTPVAGSSITGTSQSVGDGIVNVSLGTTITWVGSTPTSFCLEATNNKGGGEPWYYSSSAGGLTQTACTS
jgi:hypothetical protein